VTADDGQDGSAIAGSDGAGVRCRLLVPDEFAEAVELVTVAVAELSFYRWLFGDAMSDEALRWAAERKCGCVRRGGSIGAFDTDGRLVGLLVLNHPGQPAPTTTDDQLSFLTELVKANLDVARRFQMLRKTAEQHPVRPDAIDVAHAVVEPRLRNSGILRTLAIATYEVAMERGHPLTLRTNVPELAVAYREKLLCVDTGSYVDASGATTWVLGQEVADMPAAIARLRARTSTV